ncbi:endonuclease domain-containing 1 protein-like [Mantella aurantiaca]
MFLSLCWLLVAIACKAEGRVDDDFTKCSQAFYRQRIPLGFEGIAKPHDFKEIPDGINIETDLASPAYICQTLGGISYYATLYDRGRRIPLYSAYILDRKNTNQETDCKRTGAFKLEPQLIYRGVTENMQLVTDVRRTIKNYNSQNNILQKYPKNQPNFLMETSQAVDSDYTESKTPNGGQENRYRYNRGHLNPCGHHSEKNNYLSTYTLTNVVPMVSDLNSHAWCVYEKEMITISAGCSKMYVVTGSVPGNYDLKNRVTIPSYVWNAYCCVDNNGKPLKSGGAIAANEKALTIDNKYTVDKMKLSDLQVKLKDYLKVSKNIEIFVCGCNPNIHSQSCSFIQK